MIAVFNAITNIAADIEKMYLLIAKDLFQVV